MAIGQAGDVPPTGGKSPDAPQPRLSVMATVVFSGGITFLNDVIIPRTRPESGTSR